MRLLYVVPDLEYNGAARQMLCLATGLPRDQFDLRVCVLRGTAPWRKELIRAGIPVDVFEWRRTFDARPLIELRKIIRGFQPDVIHVWRRSALWAVSLVKSGTAARLIVSSSAYSPPMNIVDRWLLRRADKVVAGGFHEAQALQSLGLAAERIATVPPAVSLSAESDGTPLRAALGLSPEVPLVACVGPLEPEKGFRDAVWALDVLSYVYDAIHLLLIGTGSASDQLRHFSRVAQVEEFVHFLGPQENVPTLLTEAEMVWVPSHRNTGVNAALEAMAAGRPLVATHMPVLAELVPMEAKSTLIAPRDQGSLARQTRLLLDDPDRRSRLAELGRTHVAENHSVRALVENCVRLYEELGT
jgi:glycosyltransferase involved in cell wall biosynthesis